MKISELVATLNARMAKHGDLEVDVTWESVTRGVWQDNVYLSKKGVLLIDADENFYKNDFAVDPTEGDDEVAV